MKAIKDLLDTFRGETYNLCYEILTQTTDEEKAFEFVCKNYRTRSREETLEIQEYFSEAEIEELESAYGDTVNGLLNSTIKKCNLGIINYADFYKVLWDSYCLNFPGVKERAFAFYYTIIDVTIPYQYLGKPINMSKDRFQELVNKNKANFDKVMYIKNSNYSQRTEEVSLLLNCLDSIEDFESKIVVLVFAIKTFTRDDNLPSSIELLKELEKKLSELSLKENED